MTDTKKEKKKIFGYLDSLTHLLKPKNIETFSLSMELKMTTSP